MNVDRGDGSNAPTSQNQTQDIHEDAEYASEAKILANDDRAEGSNTTRDASSDLITPSQEENCKVGGSQQDREASRPSNQKKKAVSIAECEAMSEYFAETEKPKKATERSEEVCVQKHTLTRRHW